MTGRRTALSAVAACLVSVLILRGVNFWLAIASAAALGVVWSIGELVAEEIQGRRNLRRLRQAPGPYDWQKGTPIPGPYDWQKEQDHE